MASCIICDAKVHARARCHSCYVYWRRHGKDRTDEMAAKANRRTFDRLRFKVEVQRAYRLAAKAS